MFFKKKRKYSFQEAMTFFELLSCKHNGRNIFYYDEIAGFSKRFGYDKDFVEYILNNRDWVIKVGEDAYRI